MGGVRPLAVSARIVEALRRSVLPRRLEKLAAVAACRVRDTTVVLENLGDEGNVAAVMRTAEALGVHEVHVVRSYVTTSPSRASPHTVSAGADAWLTVRNHAHVRDALDCLRGEGYWIAATSLGEGATDLARAVSLSLAGRQTGTADAVRGAGSSPRPRVALILGNERRGVSSAAAALADVNFFIQQSGMTQSLNVSTAAAIALHAFLHRTPDYARLSRHAHTVCVRRPEPNAAGVGEGAHDPVARMRGVQTCVPIVAGGAPPVLQTCETLDEAERVDALARWLIASVKRSASILEKEGVRPDDL